MESKANGLSGYGWRSGCALLVGFRAQGDSHLYSACSEFHFDDSAVILQSLQKPRLVMMPAQCRVYLFQMHPQAPCCAPIRTKTPMQKRLILATELLGKPLISFWPCRYHDLFPGRASEDLAFFTISSA